MDVPTVLTKYRHMIGRVLSTDYRNKLLFVMDFSQRNEDLSTFDPMDPDELMHHIEHKLLEHDAVLAVSKYNEPRAVHPLDASKEAVHLGIDLWSCPGAFVFAPLAGKVHSLGVDTSKGGHGPTAIIEHELEGIKFYTLYGHLSIESLDNLQVGKQFNKGEVIGRLGHQLINGNWPGHLHFQLITDLQGHEGIFPGLVPAEQKNDFLNICPNPNLILQIPCLATARGFN